MPLTSAPAASAGRPRTVGSNAGGRTVAVLCTLLVLTVLLQRFALPIGTEGISVTLVIAYAGLVVLLGSGRLVHDVTRLLAFALGLAACGLATWLASLSNLDLSLGSYLLLGVVYLPWVFRLADPAVARRGFEAASRTFVTVMVLAGVVGIVQLGAQLLGVWSYQDPIADLVGEQWLVGNYNTTIPLQYGSALYKSQAFVFLEPSFLCQFLALALLLGLVRRDAWWKLLILGLGMFCTYSGTGMVLLGVGLLLIALRMPGRLRRGFSLVAVAVAVGLLTSPYAAPLLKRSHEASNSTSSLSLRFVQPYEQVAQGLTQEPMRYLTGGGPGSAERLLENARQGAGLAVTYTIAPKLIFEYGVVGGGLFLIFLALALLRGPPSMVIPGALAVMLGLLSGSLLQPHTILTAWLLSVVWGREPRPAPPRRAGPAYPNDAAVPPGYSTFPSRHGQLPAGG